MNTYADYLNTMTVKSLNVIARDMGLTRYGKLRKAALISFIDDAINADYPTVAPVVEFTSKAVEVAVTNVTPKAVAVVAFSAKPAVKRVAVVPVKTETVANPYGDVETDDLIEAYQGMRKTLHKSRGDVHMRLASRLRLISRELKSRKVAMREI